MTRENFIDNLYNAMYKNIHPFSKENYIINIIDKFISEITSEINKEKICKNCKYFKNGNCKIFQGAKLKCTLETLTKENFGCNKFKQREE